ncbi:MAG: hypothetical protein WA705_21510, partial [Candidatus Ozemobacteraceae bacterium]
CHGGTTEEPYALIGHVRDCGGGGEQSLLLPGDKLPGQTARTNRPDNQLGQTARTKARTNNQDKTACSQALGILRG